MRSETLSKTKNEKIFVEQQEIISPRWIMESLKLLDHVVTGEVSGERVIATMKKLVNTYHSPEEVNASVGEEVKNPDEDLVLVGSGSGLGERE